VSGNRKRLSSYRIDFVEAQRDFHLRKSPQNEPSPMYDGGVR